MTPFSIQPVCGRFAPSPSGRIHLGNIWAALLAWLAARSAGGTLLLRLEDLDRQRCKPFHCDQLLRDLEWLGLDWDGAPVYQSQRIELYHQAFRHLAELGLLYPCFCTRAQRFAASAPHLSQRPYSGRCAHLTPQESHLLAQTTAPAWRIRTTDQLFTLEDALQGTYSQRLSQSCGDFLLRRSDGIYAYQLAVVVDDGAMGVNQVVRGRDLLDSTPRQIYLQQLLNLPRPSYGHLPLLLASSGQRLAKRDHALDLGALQTRYTAPQLIGYLAFYGNLIPEPLPITAQELIPLFSWSKLPQTDLTPLLPED